MIFIVSLWDKWEQFIRQKQLFKPIYENRFKTFLQPSKNNLNIFY